MDELSLPLLFGSLIFLMVLSAFFSSSETAMMSLNRYRLRHMAEKNHSGAKRAENLLKRPDKLIGMILIGNNFVNSFAAALGTLIAIRLWGEDGVAAMTVIITVVMLVFSEITPKAIAAIYPEKIALPATLLLKPLLKIFYPAVWSMNFMVSGVAKLFGVNITDVRQDHLSIEELRTLVRDGALLPQRRRGMLLSILDLEKSKVEDIMIPRPDVVGIDLDDDIDHIIEQISASQHTRLPVYAGDVNEIHGILHMRNASRFLNLDEPHKDDLLKLCQAPYFVPEGTPLNTQLFNFQKAKERIGLVVDEYGEVLGVVTLEDILEEIVGQFTSNFASTNQDITPEAEGSYIIAGSTTLREINRTLKWDLPTRGPKTLNGLMMEMLEAIPESNVCLQIGDYFFELLQIKDNTIKTVRVARIAHHHDQETENI